MTVAAVCSREAVCARAEEVRCWRVPDVAPLHAMLDLLLTSLTCVLFGDEDPRLRARSLVHGLLGTTYTVMASSASSVDVASAETTLSLPVRDMPVSRCTSRMHFSTLTTHIHADRRWLRRGAP